MLYTPEEERDEVGNGLLDKIAEAVLSQMGTPTHTIEEYNRERDNLVREEISDIEDEELYFFAIWFMTDERPYVEWETTDTIFDIIMDILYVNICEKVDMHWEIDALIDNGEIE